ncbi:hypothetical protein DLAC_05030 [Tieghemostelium lacteum]|uniref:F-box domain-containing protein n=1 Tax=Tieghemostelium lacteum TaxID=361077 RepID=A0A151ZIB0_TIELA|nr:hypothetical protein DLAC_05030 [Tieghemostelium lacteum]|eukprot:KYQ93647.1 hypothetical protein DLAC_05030 [Tieghemostelium lacteum]
MNILKLPELLINRIFILIHNEQISKRLLDLILVCRFWKVILNNKFNQLVISRPLSNLDVYNRIQFTVKQRFHRIRTLRVSHIAVSKDIEDSLSQALRNSCHYLHSISLIFCNLLDTSVLRIFQISNIQSTLLSKIDLSFNRVTIVGFKHLFQFINQFHNNQIKSLNLSHNALFINNNSPLLEQQTQPHTISNNWKIEKLNISFNHLMFSNVVDIMKEDGLKWLRVIHLATISFGGEGYRYLRNLVRLKVLTKLDLQLCYLHGDSFQELLEILSMNPRESNITDLCLSGQRPINHIIDHLERLLVGNDRILKLNLSNCELSDHSCKRLSQGIENNCSLTDLRVSRNTLTHVGGGLLLSVCSKSYSLTSLDLSYNQLGPNSCVAIQSFLQQSSNIKSLDISYNAIKSNDITVIFDSIIHNQTIQYLNLRGNQFKQTIVLPFYKLVKFKESQKLVIDISNNSLVFTEKRSHQNLILH